MLSDSIVLVQKIINNKKAFLFIYGIVTVLEKNEMLLKMWTLSALFQFFQSLVFLCGSETSGPGQDVF